MSYEICYSNNLFICNNNRYLVVVNLMEQIIDVDLILAMIIRYITKRYCRFKLDRRAENHGYKEGNYGFYINIINTYDIVGKHTRHFMDLRKSEP